jgi:hypothetical protein
VVGVALLASNLASWKAMDTPTVGREENDITCKIYRQRCLPSAYALQGSREVSAYIDYIERVVPPGNVLIDTYRGFSIPLVSAHPARYIVTSDQDFERSILHPFGEVRYLLVPNPGGLGSDDRINRAYPSLWRHGSSWTKLVREFSDTRDDWKLYRVIRSP